MNNLNLISIEMTKENWTTLSEELEATINGYSNYKNESVIIFIDSLKNILSIIKEKVND
jgi:hypothetical protein